MESSPERRRRASRSSRGRCGCACPQHSSRDTRVTVSYPCLAPVRTRGRHACSGAVLVPRHTRYRFVPVPGTGTRPKAMRLSLAAGAALARGSGALCRGGLARARCALPLELVEPLLDRSEPPLELVDRADALLQLVDAVAKRPERAEHLVRPGCAADPLDRLLAGSCKPLHDVLLSGPGHGPIVPVAIAARRAYAPPRERSRRSPCAPRVCLRFGRRGQALAGHGQGDDTEPVSRDEPRRDRPGEIDPRGFLRRRKGLG